MLDESKMISAAIDISEDVGRSVVSFEGITSIEVEYSLDSAAYQTFRDSDLVYFIDMTEALELLNNAGQDVNISPTLPDYAWIIEGLKEE